MGRIRGPGCTAHCGSAQEPQGVTFSTPMRVQVDEGQTINNGGPTGPSHPGRDAGRRGHRVPSR